MTSSNRNVTQNLPLKQLVRQALRELERMGYSRRSLRRYRTIWQHLIAFSTHNGFAGKLSEPLTAQFVEAYRFKDDEHIETRRGWRRHVVFGVKVLEDFARDGCIERSRTDMQKVSIPPAMKKSLRDYERYCRDRRHLRPTTLSERIREIAIFLDYLGSRDVQKLALMQPADLMAFVVSRQHFRPKTVSRIISGVRLFLQFLLMRGVLQQDLSQVLPKVRVSRDASIPSVWEPELVRRLLEVVDRSSPRGKRDYAILLLACRLGLRVGDIRRLRLDDIHWEAATIEIVQSKTCAPLRLPLTEEVGAALIDYLRAGRPKTEYREVFLRLKSPIIPFGDNSRLHHVVSYWRRLAGIRIRNQHRQGLHSLRHTFASLLLQEQTPIHVISEILGHATTASTLIYAKADTESLRGVALDPEEVRHVD